MQKRVVYDFNAQTATESAAENSTDKAVKTSNAIGKIKRAFSGKSFKLVVLIVLLFASLFCTIGSADWIISQQKVVPNVAGNSIFKFDDLGFGAHVNNGKPTGNYTFNGSSISISMSVAAVGGVQNLPDSAIEAQNIRYRVKKCAPDTKPENLNEEFFNSDYATVLPKYAGTYAVLITSEADGVSYGKTIKVFTIAPCPVKIEWSGAVGFTYDGTDHSRNITATARTENGAAVNENIFEISFSYKAHGATTFTPVTEVKNAGTYTATVTISNDNYKLSGSASTNFTIIPLKIAFNGIIESDYKSSGIALNAELFNGKFKINETIADASSVDLSTVHNDIIGGTAKNFSGNEDTSKPENGFYSYAFGKNITAGSTYLISNITLDPTSNFELTTKSVYLKYKTAKVGEKFYTIEDALAQSGTITLCGDASNDSSYVITAFSKLSLSAGNGDKFKDYKSDYKYTLSGKKLIASFNDSTKEEDVNSSYDKAGNVFSALVISKGVTITLSSSASMIAAAEIGFSYSICTTLAKNHGVIMNDGNIVVNSGCSVTAYGYIKGNGLIQMNSGATALDALTIYDWPGGDAAKDMYKTAFPTNAYTVHNISCPTKVFSGAIYKARVYLNAVGGTIGLNEPIVIIGTQNNKGMFNADSDSSASDYIFKSVITNQKDIETAKDINSNIALSNQRATGTVTTLNHRDNIEIYGKYSDAPTEISKTVLFITIALKTSTSIPLPVGFMDITVRNKSTLTLNSSDYLILPGAKLTVDNGGKLTLGNNVDLVALPYASAPTTGNYRYTRFYTANTDGNGKKDGKLIVNGTLSGSGYSLGGNISTEQAGATLNIVNASGSYVTMQGSSKPYYETGTVNAFGDIMTSQSSYAQRNLSTGTYYSTKIDSDYVWYKNSATITYHTNGGTLNGNTTQNITLPSGGYISSNLPEPTRHYYEFNGWYYDSALTQKATAIFASCDLYAKWTPIQYTIIYNLPYKECGTLVNDSLSGTEVKTLATPPQQTITVDGTEYTFSSWYLNSDRTGKPITEVSAVNANGKIINVYAFYRGGTYTVNYDVDPENLLYNNNLKIDEKPESQTFDKGMAVPESKLNSLNSYNGKTFFMFYFAGWYLSTDSSTIITSLSSTINGDITLCAKWIKKAQLKIELPVFENGNRTGNTTIYDTHKYFYKQKTDPIGIKNLLTYIGAGYTVPENYKFIGFNASSGFTATQDYSDMNNITTRIEVGATSDVLTITADIRKILRVDITMTASATYSRGWLGEDSKDFEINQILISSNSFYSKTNSDDWFISNGTTDIKQLTKGTQTFYLLEDSNGVNIEIYIKDISIKVVTKTKTFYASNITFTQTGGCTKNTTISPFKFTIKDDSTLSWTKQQTAT